ncbi:MAG: YraN family protein [Candidatus Schekmanbacteria bacterium]|nr:YraN family protein [Candidatus Schekmanbacteria bacterium]
MQHLQTGKLGETFALAWLKNNGYQVLQTNYHCRWGEIDLIAQSGSVLVFVEVKTRCGNGFGTPQAAVTISKQKKMSQTALTYLNEHQITNQDCRFDVIAVLLSNNGSLRKIELISDAFNFIE